MKRPYIFNVLTSSLNLKGTMVAALLMLFAFVANAQVGIGTISPNSSAQLDVTSTTKGLLIPRMLDSERSDIANPATGLLVYQTNGNAGFWYYTGTQWVPLKMDAGNNAMIPFASGSPIVMTTIAGGLVGLSSISGFGASATNVSIVGGVINANLLSNMAFSVPRAGTITSLSASFSASIALALVGSTVTVQAQLYSAPAGSNSFTAVAGALVTMSPALTGVISIGDVTYGTTSGLSIPVAAGTRLMLVYSASASGLTLINTVTGYGSGGLAIN